MRNYFNYFTEIEEYFAQKRGKNLLISPLDWSLIELWKDSGVPLHIALRGIDRSFESASRRQKSPPRTLFYCHPAVMEAFQEFSEASVGRGEDRETPPAGDRAEITGLLEDLLARLKTHDRPEVRRQAPLVRRLLEEVRRRPDLPAAEVDRDLGSLAARLSAELESGLPAGAVREIDRQVAAAVKPYRRRLSDDMLERLKQNHRQRLIRERFSVPEMSLL